MNEQNPQGAPVESTPSPSFKDRHVGLIIFGVFTIIMGCLCALFVPLMLVGQMASAKAGTPSAPAITLLPAVFIYGIMAVALVWLGIGSIMARRWARALLLIYSWSWLVVGMFVIISMAFFMPRFLTTFSSGETTGQPAMPAAAIVGVLFVMFLFLSVAFVILPGVWTYFYSSRHVKATCEARDPVTSWTDACPLPVLACCLWQLFGASTMLITALTGHSVIPFFGFFMTGVAGAALFVVMAAIWGCAAWLLYKPDPRGWWLLLIAMCVFMTSSILTFMRHDFVELYRMMGYADVQIEQIRKTGLLEGHRIIWLTTLSAVPFLAYLVFIKRFLKKGS